MRAGQGGIRRRKVCPSPVVLQRTIYPASCARRGSPCPSCAASGGFVLPIGSTVNMTSARPACSRDRLSGRGHGSCSTDRNGKRVTTRQTSWGRVPRRCCSQVSRSKAQAKWPARPIQHHRASQPGTTRPRSRPTLKLRSEREGAIFAFEKAALRAGRATARRGRTPSPANSMRFRRIVCAIWSRR
jgi:hypothetical protein